MLVCGGCGAAPLGYLAEMACQTGHVVHVVLGARSAEALFFRERLIALGCVVHLATDDGSTGFEGTAVECAASLLAGGGTSVRSLYACGPEPMLEAVYALGQGHQLPCQLSYEAYMRCGIGVCGSCAREGQLVCWDGPVFPKPPGRQGQCSPPGVQLPGALSRCRGRLSPDCSA